MYFFLDKNYYLDAFIDHWEQRVKDARNEKELKHCTTQLHQLKKSKS